jgi:hypothetical protein
MRFVKAKRLDAKDIHKEMFPIYGRKCLSCKAVHNWTEKRGKRFADDEEVETEERKWLRQQTKHFYTAAYSTQSKAMEQVYQCWWRNC